jgi:hypothetical protein
MVYLFTKNGCGVCDLIKSRFDFDNMENVRVYNLDRENSEALAMLAYCECVSLSEKQLPILVSESREVITGAVDISNYLVSNCANA